MWRALVFAIDVNQGYEPIASPDCFHILLVIKILLIIYTYKYL